jgi:hypothetical protein
MKNFLNTLLLALCTMATATTVQAQISYTTLYAAQEYFQTTANVSYVGSYFSLGLATQTQDSFTGATVLVPGASAPLAMNWNPRLLSNGAYGGNYVDGYFPSADGNASTNLATLSAAFPMGIYTFIAKNSVTSTQQSASLNYNANYWPTVPGSAQTATPALTSSSFMALQGASASSQLTFKFNSFTGSAVICCGETPLTNPSVNLAIVNASTGALAYESGPLAASVGSVVLPTNTLQVNTDYMYYLDFSVGRHCGYGQSCDSINPIGSGMAWATSTGGQFSTAMAPPPNTTTVNLQGGTLANPVALQSEGRIGQVNGAIGGAGAQDFYLFYWAGGVFQANARLYGADPLDKYSFELLDQHGNVLESFALDQSNNFTADLSHNLAKGANYEIGILADASNIDPAYSITLQTPIAAVPEPSMALLLCLGFAAIGFSRGWRGPKTKKGATRLSM